MLRLRKSDSGPLKVNRIIVARKGQGVTKTFNCGGYEIGGNKPDNLENLCKGKNPLIGSSLSRRILIKS